jgi:prepilin-type N-terminal cleavage/methylation domain-containing protein
MRETARADTQRGRSDRARRTGGGFTLVEVVVVVVVLASLLAITGANLGEWTRNQRAKGTARAIADLLTVTRAEAVRSGRVHVVFFGGDMAGTDLVDSSGQPAAALSIVDLDGDGAIDGNERVSRVAESIDAFVRFGHAVATDRATGDPGGSSGSAPIAAFTFDRPDGTAASWVAFLPDGTPRAYVNDSLPGTGALGSGGGAVYVTSGARDYAVVLTPLGAVQVQAWDPQQTRWRR